MGGRRPKRDWLGMIREHVEREKLLRLRIEQLTRRLESQQEDIGLQAKRYEALLNAQRVVIERLVAQKQQA